MLYWQKDSLSTLFDFDFASSQIVKIATDLDIGSFAASISGGAIVRTFLKDDVFKGDIDIFPHTEEGLEDLVHCFKNQKTWIKSPHAYNFEYVAGVRKTKVQIIIRDKPVALEETLNKFDLEHCKFGMVCSKGEDFNIFTSYGAPVTLAQKKIRLAFIREPNYTMGRVIKYKRMGFEADKALEQLAAMSIKKMTNVNCCTSDADGFSLSDLEIDMSIKSVGS